MKEIILLITAVVSVLILSFGIILMKTNYDNYIFLAKKYNHEVLYKKWVIQTLLILSFLATFFLLVYAATYILYESDDTRPELEQITEPLYRIK